MPEFKDPQAEKHYYETEASQEEFLTWYQKQEFPNYPKPALTVDNVILRWYQADPEEAPQLQLLLIKRKAHPSWVTMPCRVALSNQMKTPLRPPFVRC